MSKDILNKLKAQNPETKTPDAAGNVLPEESVGDMLNQLNAAQRSGNVQTGMASTATGARPHSSMSTRPSEPLLPGYYTLGWGSVRLPNRQVVKSTTLRGKFYYPLDSPAAKFLEARVGNGVTKVTK